MASYRIVCVKTEHAHRHIVSVGTGTDAAKPTTTYTVTQVRNMIDNGDMFTTSDASGKTARVRKDDCGVTEKVGGVDTKCTVKTIRSTADAVKDNNLDNLPVCP